MMEVPASNFSATSCALRSIASLRQHIRAVDAAEAAAKQEAAVAEKARAAAEKAQAELAAERAELDERKQVLDRLSAKLSKLPAEMHEAEDQLKREVMRFSGFYTRFDE